MAYLYVRHKVEDFDRWFAVFESHRPAHRESGFGEVHVSRDCADPDIVVLFFEVLDMEKARAFTETPESYEAKDESGVVGDPLALWLEEI